MSGDPLKHTPKQYNIQLDSWLFALLLKLHAGQDYGWTDTGTMFKLILARFTEPLPDNEMQGDYVFDGICLSLHLHTGA